MSELRLQKYIADCGITSRRKAEELIVQGRVQVNGDTVRVLGTKVNPDIDAVIVDGQIADLGSIDKVYLVMNKPRGYVTTVEDPEGRKTVMDLCKEVSERIYPVGRLDYLSEGLLLLTNDGEVANMVMHPSFNITKVYEVKVFGSVTETILKKLRNGVQLEEGFVKPLSVRVIKQLPNKTWVEFRLGEGRNREIRKICEACGLTVDKLKRVAIEGLTVEGIAPGKSRYISKKQLLNLIGVDADGKKLEGDRVWMSSKKTVNLKKKGVQAGTAADDEAWIKYRKETYFKSVKELDERRKQEEEQARAASLAARDEAHFARKKKKALREKKKADANYKAPHAVIVD
ncbi:pseudouridine synthase [Halobacteriovorax sp. JY17]|uniref:pseudouridine synthase n=1 Tax=Halobacteriovorax sp. JY17 TaxID=2014617 RepID=UPI000C6A4213|nr:pseudouridine synthase [Halobacteriovorax sp. JY17]PIK14755.1 MAG: pseudouridine synthase [Halobacteriovorax sp. JY17]